MEFGLRHEVPPLFSNDGLTSAYSWPVSVLAKCFCMTTTRTTKPATVEIGRDKGIGEVASQWVDAAFVG
jgi:hypothetical protein